LTSATALANPNIAPSSSSHTGYTIELTARVVLGQKTLANKDITPIGFMALSDVRLNLANLLQSDNKSRAYITLATARQLENFL
jgi:hypothetical protein